jgi:hypothetical protein
MVESLVNNLGLSYELTVLHCDSQSVIHLAKNWMNHEMIKNINVV